MTDALLAGSRAAVVFLAFAMAYFLSTLVRAITATLSPTLSAEFELQSQELGLLAGGYFLGFALMQLPMGNWLDRHGPKRVILTFLFAAVAGCLLFSFATNFWVLLGARVLAGIGLSACLMAPLTGYRRWFSKRLQLRSNAWMLMMGSLGVVASTIPVHALLPLWGWRPIFWLLAACLLLAIVVIAWAAPDWESAMHRAESSVTPAPSPTADPTGYAAVWRDPFFRKMAPLGFFNYGGFTAMLTLWVVPWLIRVGGASPGQAADGLFWISFAMLVTYGLWGVANPRLAHRGIAAETLIKWLLPLGMAALAAILLLGSDAGALAWAVFLSLTTVVTLAQPAVAMALPPALAGRALSAYNLVVFLGVFTVQWGVGLLIDLFLQLGFSTAGAFRTALGLYLGCCVSSYCYFLWAAPHNHRSAFRSA
ncbi:Predicted arabinose efflux permease, MFS family [Burkholderiales bacterium 8X]|nr:Predicted arabinose efflux permease, MFS family [Burkholderiales bacterium 8X]